MRKHRLITPRRSPGFDALEGRQLLSAGNFGPARVEPIVVVPPPARGFDPGPAEFAPMLGFQQESPRPDGPAASGAGLISCDSWIRSRHESGPGDGLASLWADREFGSIGNPAFLNGSPEFSAGGAQAVLRTGFSAGDAWNSTGILPDFSPGGEMASMMPGNERLVAPSRSSVNRPRRVASRLPTPVNR